MEYLSQNWEYFMLAFVILEKVVKATPCKWDDILFDIIFKSIKDRFSKKEKK